MATKISPIQAFKLKTSRPFFLRSALLWSMTTVALALLSACGKPDDNKTVGQKVDAAIAKSEQAAAETKVKTESAIANASSALKEAAQKVEISSKSIAQKAEAKFDDVTITANIKAEIARDIELSAFKLNVDTVNGAVVIKGIAPTSTAKDRVAKIAKAVQGVTAVDNQVVVQGS